MDALDFLRAQCANADRTLRQVFEPVTPEQAAWRPPGSKANTIGATFMHAYFSEDKMVHEALGRSSVFDTGGWKDRLGYDHDSIWTYTGHHQPALLQEYANSVTEATNEYLSRLTPQYIEEQIDTQRGPQPRANRLAIYLINHKFQHTGDIAALLGCQGVQGLPF